MADTFPYAEQNGGATAVYVERGRIYEVRIRGTVTNGATYSWDQESVRHPLAVPTIVTADPRRPARRITLYLVAGNGSGNIDVIVNREEHFRALT